jgi:hypothetical protein
MKIADLENKEDGLITFPLTIHISEVDRMAGELINYMGRELPGLTSSAAVEVLNVAMWWTQLAAYTQFGIKVSKNPEHIKNSYWKHAGMVDGFKGIITEENRDDLEAG